LLNKAVKNRNGGSKRRASDRFMTVGYSSCKPTYADIPNDIADAMRRVEPQEVANIFFSKEM